MVPPLFCLPKRCSNGRILRIPYAASTNFDVLSCHPLEMASCIHLLPKILLNGLSQSTCRPGLPCRHLNSFWASTVVISACCHSHHAWPKQGQRNDTETGLTSSPVEGQRLLHDGCARRTPGKSSLEVKSESLKAGPNNAMLPLKHQGRHAFKTPLVKPLPCSTSGSGDVIRKGLSSMPPDGAHST